MPLHETQIPAVIWVCGICYIAFLGFESCDFIRFFTFVDVTKVNCAKITIFCGQLFLAVVKPKEIKRISLQSFGFTRAKTKLTTKTSNFHPAHLNITSNKVKKQIKSQDSKPRLVREILPLSKKNQS